MESYIPINCDFYDELEALATLKKPAEIVFITENEGKLTVKGVITDLFIRDKVEFMSLDNGLEIRLDKLLSVNGKEPNTYC
jgi:Rho-binding antiterminator